jgi:hypothetical protein
MFLLMGMIAFIVYKLIVLAAFSVLLVIGLSAGLVFMIAFSLKEAADKVIVKIKPVFETGDNEAIRKWAGWQFKSMLVLLGCSLFSAVMLASFGGILVKIGIFVQNKDFIDLILGCFGFLIFILGCYFICILIKEIRFVSGRKEVFIAKIIEQLRG